MVTVVLTSLHSALLRQKHPPPSPHILPGTAIVWIRYMSTTALRHFSHRNTVIPESVFSCPLLTHSYAQSHTKGIASHASILPIPVTFPLIMDYFPNVYGQFGDPDLLYFLYNTTAEKRGQLCSPIHCFLLFCYALSSQKPVCSDFSVFSSGTRNRDSKSLSPILLHMAAWKFHCGEPEAEKPS